MGTANKCRRVATSVLLAWVLWQGYRTTGSVDVSYTPLMPFETRKECEKAKDALWAERDKDPDPEKRTTTIGRTITYACWPAGTRPQ